MGLYIKMITEALDCDEATAVKVEYQMQCNGFDFSEATDLQFKSGIMNAKIDLGLEAMSDESLEALYMSL